MRMLDMWYTCERRNSYEQFGQNNLLWEDAILETHWLLAGLDHREKKRA
jgi:hypothetical protein